jgi:hypothetical protein
MGFSFNQELGWFRSGIAHAIRERLRSAWLLLRGWHYLATGADYASGHLILARRATNPLGALLSQKV